MRCAAGARRVARAALTALAALVLPCVDVAAQGSAPAAPPAAARGAPASRGVVGGVIETIGRAAEERARQRATGRYDEAFRKYARRYFGVAVDWRWFKAQGMAESNLDASARSRVGARGIMQLMPSTYASIASKQPDFQAIDHPEWNIAAGIAHDRWLWDLWDGTVHDDERWEFVFASYNAGRSTILRAQRAAEQRRLDRERWASIERVAPTVPRWRHGETLVYVRKIRANKAALEQR
jgi:soluble lytic murein transglycosylase-like protein